MPRYSNTFYAKEDAQLRREAARQAAMQREALAHESISLAVREYDRRIVMIQSLHRVPVIRQDWAAIASIPAPVPPTQRATASNWGWRCRHLQAPLGVPLTLADEESCSAADKSSYAEENARFTKASQDHTVLTSLARRILLGDLSAYTEAIQHNHALEDLTQFGADIDFTVLSPRQLECSFTSLGSYTIPAEVVSLTSTGRLAKKAMPKALFQELYQDHIASCVLRLEKELFATAPVDSIIITALTRTGDYSQNSKPEPVISVIIHRDDPARRYDIMGDPSDTLERFQCRTNFKATRKLGGFQPIEPFTQADIGHAMSSSVDTLLKTVRLLQEEFE